MSAADAPAGGAAEPASQRTDAPAPPPALPGAAARLTRFAPTIGFLWQHKLTPAGRWLLLAFLVIGAVASSVGIQFPLYVLASFLLCLFLVAQALGTAFRPRLAVARVLPDRCAAHARVVVSARVTNLRGVSAFDLAVSEQRPPAELGLEPTTRYFAVLPPGATAELTYAFCPARRGSYDLRGPVALSAFPFGLYHVSRDVPAPHRLLVYPRFAPFGLVDLPVSRKHQPGGLQLVSHVGDSEEFVGLREYRPGDRLRDLHHRAWARTGEPVVREYQQEYLCRIALVVDTYVPRGRRQGREELEAAISLCAAVADALSRQEYVVDIFAAGPDLYHVQAGRSLAYLDNVLDVLACLEPCPESPFGRLAPALAEDLDRISSAVVVLLDWNADREAFCGSLRDCGVAVKVVVVRDGPPAHDPRAFDPGVAHLTPAQVALGGERL